MCCIFTVCGWVVDFIQRVWTFAMACCISSAICCSVVFAAMSGIALGYNYSLAEYIDLKETNVSVYLKRGVFDDEIADDKDWRRMAGFDEKPSSSPDVQNRFSTEEEAALTVGRRMDDSILSDDQRKFEGFLVKLTAKPIYSEAPPPTPAYGTTLVEENWFSKFTKDQLLQLKAFQAEINREKAKVLNQMTNQDNLATVTANNIDQRNLVHFPYPAPTTASRRNMNNVPELPPDSPRLAVPGQNIRDPYNWRRAELPNQVQLRGDLYVQPTIPSPIPLPGPIRPTRYTLAKPPTKTHEETSTAPSTVKSVMDQLDDFKKDLIMEKYDKNMDPDDFLSKLKSGVNKITGDEYDDDMDIKGLPVRKRRSIAIETRNISQSASKNTSNTVSNMLVQVEKDDEDKNFTSLKIDVTEISAITDFLFDNLFKNTKIQKLKEELSDKFNQSINKTEVGSAGLFQKFLNYFHVHFLSNGRPSNKEK